MTYYVLIAFYFKEKRIVQNITIFKVDYVLKKISGLSKPEKHSKCV